MAINAPAFITFLQLKLESIDNTNFPSGTFAPLRDVLKVCGLIVEVNLLNPDIPVKHIMPFCLKLQSARHIGDAFTTVIATINS